MRIVEPKPRPPIPQREVDLIDGRTISDDEIDAEELRRGKEIPVQCVGHVFYRSSLEDPKGTFLYEEVEEK